MSAFTPTDAVRRVGVRPGAEFRLTATRVTLSLRKFESKSVHFLVLRTFLWVQFEPTAMEQDRNAVVGEVSKASRC